jgi:hypothetical protein
MTKKPTAKPQDRAPETNIERLLRYIGEEEVRIDAESDPTKRQTAMRTLVMLASELRKAEKADVDAIKKLSPAVVMTWVKSQTPEYRARLVRDVTAIDAIAKRSVLG